jgi:3D (Asp-Asp-Asp) domain-containing protein
MAAPKCVEFWIGVWVPGYGCGAVQDRGGSIKGKHIDLWFPLKAGMADDWGVDKADVEVRGISRVESERPLGVPELWLT